MTPKAVERPRELFRAENWTILEAGDGEAGIQPGPGTSAGARSFAICSCRERTAFKSAAPFASICSAAKSSSCPAAITVSIAASAIEAGADEYLVKPISWENLREVIDRGVAGGRRWPAPTGPVPDFTPPSTRLRFWGVRGSIPVPGSSTVGYGGNTSCIEVRADGEIIVLDAGSGMRELGHRTGRRNSAPGQSS